MLVRTLSLCLWLSLLLPDLTQSQCIILGTDMPCYGSETFYHLNYTSPFGDTIVSTTWSLSPVLGDTMHTTKDTIIYLWTKSGSTTLHARIITSNNDTVDCYLPIQVKPNKKFEIHTNNDRKCGNTEIFNFCEGDSAVFYTESDSLYTYFWKLNDTLLQSNSYQTEVIHFPTQGLQTIIVSAIDTITGCIGKSETKTIKVNKAPIAEIKVLDLTIDSIVICRDQKVTYENKTTPQTHNLYLWEIFDASNNSLVHTFSSESEDAFEYIFNAAGTYVVRLTAQNCYGCQSYDEFKVIVNDDRAVVIDCPSVVCQDSVKEVMYEAKDTCTSYTWTVIGSRHYRVDSNKIWVKWDSFPPNGIGYVKLQTSGCNGAVCDGITIAEVPILPRVGTITGEKGFCNSNGESSFEVPMWPGASYQWSIIPDDDPDLTISRGEKDHRVFIARDGYTGSFRIKVKVEHPLADCYFEKEDSIRIHNISLPDDEVCFGANALFEFDSNGESIDSAFWTFITNMTYKKNIDNSNLVTFDSSTTRVEGFKNLYLKLKFSTADYCLDTARIRILRSIAKPTINGPEIICLDSSYIYTVLSNPPSGGTLEWMIVNGTKLDSTTKSIKIRWTSPGKNNKFIKARFHVGECYSDWSVLHVIEIDSIVQLISGNPYPCEDTSETYKVLAHPTRGKQVWILDSVFGQIHIIDANRISIQWHMVPHDTTVILTYRDSVCGSVNEYNYPITIINRDTGIITNSAECAEKDIVFNINVKANKYYWDFGDGTIDSTEVDSIIHKYSSKGFYRVNVKWTGAMGCINGFSATKELEVHPTLVPFIKAFNNNTDEFVDCLTTDTIEIRFQANEYNIPGVKYHWFIDSIEQPDDTTSSLIRTHPIDTDFTIVFVKLFVEGPICTDTAYLRLDTCGSVIGCTPYDTVRIISATADSCYLRTFNGAFLPQFELFLDEQVNITPGAPVPRYLYRKGEWIFEDIRTVRKNVVIRTDLVDQVHQYEMAGYWLTRLIGNARDNMDTTQLCQTSDSRFDTIPLISDFIYTFNCDSSGTYTIRVKAQASYLAGFAPDHFTYYYNGDSYNAPGGETEFTVVDTVDQVCLMLSSGDYSCEKCISIVIPDQLLFPEIKVTDTVCASTTLRFDIMNANFTDDITDYLWDFGDGILSRVRRPIHVFNIHDTSITVKLYVSNKWGCTAMSTKNIYIVNNTLDGFLTTDSMECESHRQINMNKTLGRNPVRYLWNKSDTTASIIIGQSGNYKVTVSDPYGCQIIRDTTLLVSESFTNELVGLDSICSNLGNPKFTFYGNDALYDYYVIEKELSSGSEDTISYTGNNIHDFTFNKSGKTGTYRIVIRAYQNGSSTLCDSIIHEITIHEPNKPVILDSFNSCKPYTYLLKESNNLNLEWYEIGMKDKFVLDTGFQIQVHKGGLYVGNYTNSHGCIESDTVLIEDQIDLSPFISGCYELCDTVIDKNGTFIPRLGNNAVYSWWKYKHLDSNLVIKQGTNSIVDSFLLQKKYAGKMYLVVESQNGCVDSSDLLCLLVNRCFPPIDCDTVSMTCPHLAFIKDSFDCDSMYGYYKVIGNIVLGNEGFTLCTPNPFIINNLEWVEQPTIDVDGNIITVSGGKLRMHVDSCTSEIIINIRLCKDGAECVTQLAPYDFECYNNACGLGRAITYLQANGTHKVDVTGYVDNVVNCGDDHHWVRVNLLDEDCMHLIDHKYVSKTGFNKFRALFDVPDTSVSACYCLKVCLSSSTTQCEQECTIPFCTGSNQYLSSGGNGNINISVACSMHTTTGNIYSYNTSFDGNAYDIYLDSLIYEAETMSHSCSEGTCSGAFKIDTLATTVDMTLFFNNPNFPFQTIAIDTTVSLTNCNGGGGGHHIEGKDTGIKKSKFGEQSLITTMDAVTGSSLSLIPNPANSSTIIYYKVPDKEDGWEISILDFAGKSFEKKICCDLKGNFKFDCSDRASGMYFVILKKNGKITASKKLLINK